MIPRFIAAIVLLAVGLVSDLPACGKGDKVKVTMVVILATEEGKNVDKRLKYIAEEVRKLNPSLRGFQLKSLIDRSVAPGAKVRFDLVDSESVQIVVRHGADDANKVGLAVTAPGQGEIVYSTVCGKFLPIVTRYTTKKGQRLILAIRVQPCKGE